MKTLSIAFLAAAGLAAGGLAYAQSQMGHGTHGHMQHAQMDHGNHAGHGGHAGHGERGAVSDDPVIAAYQAVNEQMHREMDIGFTGDADIDFVRGMIPHHQGAIDMAQVVLEFGQDPMIRALAEEIIAAQDAEIAMMRGWLEERGIE